MIVRVFARFSSFVVIALVLTSALGGCQRGPTASAEEAKGKPAGPPPREVQVISAVERILARTVSATGTLAAQDLVVLGTKVAGRLAEITVDLGSRVRRGQVIGKLDQTDFNHRVDQADAALQQARVRLGLPPTGADERVDAERAAAGRQG